MARFFSGSTDKITGLNAPINFERTMSFSVALKTTMPGTGEQAFVGNLDTASNFKGWEFERRPGTNLLGFFLINSYSGNCIQCASVSSFSANTWVDVGVTYDGSSTAAGVNFYINGIAAGRTIQFDTLSATTKNSIGLQIGSRNNGTDPFNGQLAHIGIWNGILSAAEMLQLRYTSRPDQVRPLSLISYYPLTGYGAPAIDLGYAKNNGVLNGTQLASGPPLISAGPVPITPAQPKSIPAPPVFILMPQIVT